MWVTNHFKSPVASTGLLPISKTKIKFTKEGIDYKHKMMDAPLVYERNLNKLRQAISIFHNYYTLYIDRPMVKKSLADIERVTNLTKGIRGHQWIQDQLNPEGSVVNGSKTLGYDFNDSNTQLYPYIIFKYLLTQLSQEVFNVYYELSFLESFKQQRVNRPKANMVTIFIITSTYVFKIIAYDYCEDEQLEKRTSGLILIEQINGNREQIADFVKHPLEIIKTAASKTEYSFLSKMPASNTKERECEAFEKWFNGLRLMKRYDIFEFCKEEFIEQPGKPDRCEGSRISINSLNEKPVMLLKSLYNYTLKNPDSFKTSNNCIGFRWSISQGGKCDAVYSLIIDRDFHYIYIFENDKAIFDKDKTI